jgi:hypothetical protein
VGVSQELNKQAIKTVLEIGTGSVAEFEWLMRRIAWRG